jgi:5-methyltetrahydropteroyltriglutamate--homocysteine methyltransferase
MTNQKLFRTTVVGSYPRPHQPNDTLKKPTLSRDEADDLIRWAAKDQADAGLDVITDGEGRRENMYYFFQKRLDGLSFEEMEYRKYGPLGFGIEIPKVIGRIENPRFELARDWKIARESLPGEVEVKLSLAGPHMLAKFSNNARTDLYPSDKHLAEAYAQVLKEELREVVRAGCELIQFDEPAWTAFPEDALWAAGILNRTIEGLGVKIGLHVCCGNARRKRAYTTRYQDLASAFQTAKIDQVVLEHCTLDYDMMTLWDLWDFNGEFAVGVIDQRCDEVETAAEVAARAAAAIAHFSPERLLLTSECGFQHVPLEITRAKMRALVSGASHLRDASVGINLEQKRAGMS